MNDRLPKDMQQDLKKKCSIFKRKFAKKIFLVQK